MYAKTIASSSSDYQGCGIAGCTSGIRSVTESGIAIANLDGSGERLLTRGGYDTEPSFSPDGLLIAFLSHVEGDGGGVTDEVVVIDAVGGLVAELAPPASARYANPVWHPEGRSVTVLRTRVNDASAPVVATVPLDQSPPTDIASGHYEDIAWSPDGTRLAVTEMRYDNDPPYPPGHPGEPTGTDLWVLTPGGPPAQNLTNAAPPTFTNVRFCGSSGGAIPRVTTPMWSPDGQSIVYLTSYGHIAEYANVDDIDIIRSDGTGHRTLFAARHATCTPGEYAGQSKVTIPDRVTLFGWQ